MASTPDRKASRTDATASSLPVADGEQPWTESEVAEVRAGLESARERVLADLSVTEQGIADMLRDGQDTGGSDQADIGSSSLERDAEMSLVSNAREMLYQIDHARERIDDGTYGACESCGRPVGKARLLVFPRATLCLPCKQREERR